MALLTYARDVDSNMPLFAVVADDDGADYLFPEKVAPWLDEARLNALEEALDFHPTDEAGWLQLATHNLGIIVIDPAIKYGNVESAVADADKELTKFAPIESNRHLLDATRLAFDQISEDYPGFMEDEDSTTPEAMNNFVMQILGPVDPRGPNGWILREMEGKAEPGDETQYIHWPGTPLSEAEQDRDDDGLSDKDFPDDEPAPEPDDEESEPVPDDEQTEEPKDEA